MNERLKAYWGKYAEEPAYIAHWLEALGLRYLDLDEAFALCYPCVQQKCLPEDLPFRMREHFFPLGYLQMYQLSSFMTVIAFRRCLMDEDKIPRWRTDGVEYADAGYEEICESFDAYYSAEVIDTVAGSKVDYSGQCRDWMDALLHPFYPKFLTDSLREVAVRGHARGMSTTAVINDLIFADEDLSPFSAWKHDNVCGMKYLRTYLHPQLVYLKASNPRFPKKYRAAWADERERYQQALTGIPMSTVVEQVQALSDHYEKLKAARDAAEDPKDLVSLSNALVKTVAGLYAMTRDPVYQNQLEVLKQKEAEVMGASEKEAVASSESPGILDVPDAGLLMPPKEMPMALRDDGTYTEQEKDESIIT